MLADGFEQRVKTIVLANQPKESVKEALPDVDRITME